MNERINGCDNPPSTSHSPPIMSVDPPSHNAPENNTPPQTPYPNPLFSIIPSHRLPPGRLLGTYARIDKTTRLFLLPSLFDDRRGSQDTLGSPSQLPIPLVDVLRPSSVARPRMFQAWTIGIGRAVVWLLPFFMAGTGDARRTGLSFGLL